MTPIDSKSYVNFKASNSMKLSAISFFIVVIVVVVVGSIFFSLFLLFNKDKCTQMHCVVCKSVGVHV